MILNHVFNRDLLCYVLHFFQCEGIVWKSSQNQFCEIPVLNETWTVNRILFPINDPLSSRVTQMGYSERIRRECVYCVNREKHEVQMCTRSDSKRVPSFISYSIPSPLSIKNSGHRNVICNVRRLSNYYTALKVKSTSYFKRSMLPLKQNKVTLLQSNLQTLLKLVVPRVMQALALMQLQESVYFKAGTRI